MELPDISIPKAVLDSIPMEQIPALAHPALVHFAIVLPIMIVLLELVNIIVKSGETPEEPKGRGVSTLSFLLIVAMVVIFALAYLSGSVDGKASWDALSEAGQADLKAHKLIGVYLVYGSLVLLVFKLISFAGQKARVLFLLLAIAFAGSTLYQGKIGGDLVYMHGANVKLIKEYDDKVFNLNDDMSDLKEEIAELEEDNKKLKAVATPAPLVEAAKEEVEKSEEKEAVKVVATADEEKVEAPAPAPETHKAAEAEVAVTVAKDAEQAVAATESFATEAKVDEAKVEAPAPVMEAPSAAAPSPEAHEAAKAEVVATEAKDHEQAVAASESFVQEAQADTQKVATPQEVVTIENENSSSAAQ